MDNLTHLINSLLQLLIQFGNLVVSGIVAIELWLRAQLAHFGLPPTIQTVILVALAALLIVASLRMFGGLIRVALLLVLILMAIHIVLPAIQH